jgi:hypothetical protein
MHAAVQCSRLKFRLKFPFDIFCGYGCGYHAVIMLGAYPLTSRLIDGP